MHRKGLFKFLQQVDEGQLMKITVCKRFIITILLLTTLIPVTLLAEWTEIASSANGDSYSIDFDRISEDGQYVYYWRLSNYAKPTKYHDLSGMAHVKVDCKSAMTMDMLITFYKQHDAKGDGETLNRKPKWNNIHPNGTGEVLYNAVCRFAENLKHE